MKPTRLDAYQLLHNGSLALSRAEHNGIRIDVPYLEKQIRRVGLTVKQLQEKIREDDAYKQWRRRYGEKSNLGSRTQLGVVLFDVLKIPCVERTRTKRAKVDDAVLDGIDLPFVKEYRKLEKLKKLHSVYLKGVLEETQDGFLHPFFNLHRAVTYRSSSSVPNFQNVPIRDPEQGPVIRRAFRPRKGRVLVEVDYSALEFRIAACFWKDPGMVAYASDPSKDVHKDQAVNLFKCHRDQVHKDMRGYAKNQFVFPVLYGSFYKKCAPKLWQVVPNLKLKDGTPLKDWLAKKGITKLGACDFKTDAVRGTFEYHVREVEKQFNDNFPLFGKGKEDWWANYQRRGWFDLLTGFRVEGVYSRNFLLNCPVQGPAFHLLLWSFTELDREIRKKKMKSLLVGQIHDCILADVPHEEVQDYLHLIKEVMTVMVVRAMPWVITPLGVEVDVVDEDKTWHDKKPWEEVAGVWGPRR